MAIPKKGSRKIVVNQDDYRWLIRRKATDCQSDFGFGEINVAIEHADGCGATLLVKTGYPHPQDMAAGGVINAVTPVVPSDVAIWIKEAIKAGWCPQEPGPTFYFSPNDAS